MTVPHTASALAEVVARHDGVVLLLTEDACRVAEAVEPRLEAMLAERFPKLERLVVSKGEAPELAAQLGVFVFPAVLAYFGGKESARFVRAFSLDVVADALARPYGIVFG
ncbi:MAG: thioredoxin family protein [Myxococcota bacterium]